MFLLTQTRSLGIRNKVVLHSSKLQHSTLVLILNHDVIAFEKQPTLEHQLVELI